MNEIINTWDQCVAAGGDRVFIGYRIGGGRSVLPPAWVIYRIKDGREMTTNNDAPWYDYGHQTFPTHTDRESKRNTLAEAMAWVAMRYGARQWVRNRMGDYVERDVHAKFPLRLTRKKETT